MAPTRYGRERTARAGSSASPQHGQAAQKSPALAVLRRVNANSAAVAKLIHLIRNVQAIKAKLHNSNATCRRVIASSLYSPMRRVRMSIELVIKGHEDNLAG